MSPEITHDSVVAHLNSCIEGTSVPVDDQMLFEVADVNRIKKLYKLGALPSPTKEKPETKQQLENALLGAIALRGS